MASSLVLDARIGDRALSFPGAFMLNPLTELPVYGGFWADDPAWTDNPGVGQAVSSWRNGGTLAASGAYLDPTLGLVLPGTAGNYASVPDAAALDITGDITLVARVALTDWTPAATNSILGKWMATGNQRSYVLSVNASGYLVLQWSADGAFSAGSAATSSVVTGFTDGAVGWVAANLDVDDGAGNRVIKFWTSSDGVTWSQLGSTQTAVGTTSIFAGTALGEFGSVSSGTAQNVAGSVSVARIYSGSGFTTAGSSGTLVLDVDFRRTSVGAFTCDTGQTVTVASTFNANQSTAGSRPTLTTSALLGGRRVVDFDGTDDRLEILTGVSLAQPFEVWWVGVLDSVTGTRSLAGLNSAGSSRVMGVYNPAGTQWYMHAGTVVSAASPVPATGTPYLVRMLASGASSALTINGASGPAGDTGTGAVDQIIIGAGRTAPSTYANHLDGKIAFLGILPAASITATHRRQFALWAASFYSVPGFAAAA